MTAIVFHSRLFDGGHRFVLRLFFQKEEIKVGTGSIQPGYVPFPACRTHAQNIVRDPQGSHRFRKKSLHHVAQILHDVFVHSTPHHRTSRRYHRPSRGFSGTRTAASLLNRGTSFRSIWRRYHRRTQGPAKCCYHGTIVRRRSGLPARLSVHLQRRTDPSDRVPYTLVRRMETKSADAVHDRIPQPQHGVHAFALRVMVPILLELFHFQHPEEVSPSNPLLSPTFQRHAVVRIFTTSSVVTRRLFILNTGPKSTSSHYASGETCAAIHLPSETWPTNLLEHTGHGRFGVV